MSHGDDFIGYKKPPKHSRFKKGRSGNPSGRPRKSAQEIIEIFDEEMNRKVTVNENGEVRRITKERAFIRQLTNMAVKGHPTAMKLILQNWRNIKSLEELVSLPTPTMIIMPPEGPEPPMPPIFGEEHHDDGEAMD